MKLKIEMELGNSAFDCDVSMPTPDERAIKEVKRILSLACDQHSNVRKGDNYDLRDYNGHKVGKWTVR